MSTKLFLHIISISYTFMLVTDKIDRMVAFVATFYIVCSYHREKTQRRR